MGILRSMAGMVRAELTSADPNATLAALAERDIPVFEAEPEGELTLSFVIRGQDWRVVSKICAKRGDSLRLKERRGSYWVVKGLLRRPLLVLGVLFLLVLAAYLPTRVLFIRVEGNASIPTRQILAAAEDSGIRFGASRREVRSERMKNALLEAVPELQWAGVNTYGCVAVISVRERAETDTAEEAGGVSSIVAAADGVILSATATRGSLQCKPGQAVTAGQVLISGYTDCGLTIEATRAEGEVYAQTRHDLTVVTPSECAVRGEIQEERVRYSLIIGKKRINLWKDSGISDTSCGRMYEEYYITLPGGFQLPAALVKETVTVYQTEAAQIEAGDVQDAMETFASGYILQHTIAGTVTSQHFSLSQEAGAIRLSGIFLCTEMIGRQRIEKIGDIHG